MIRYIQMIHEERYMDFDYNVYFRAGLIVPLSMLLFALALVIAGVISFVKAKKRTVAAFLAKVGMFSVVFIVFLIVTVPSSLKYTVHLLSEKEDDAIYAEITVTSITSVRNSPRYSIKGDDIVRAAIIESNSESYYFMTSKELAAGDTIVIRYLPESHIVLSWTAEDE